MTAHQLLDSIGCNELEQTFRWIDSVEVVPMISAGGVRQSDTNCAHFVVTLNDCHKNTEELLETFVHELLHVILFVSFPCANHEDHHAKIREASASLVENHTATVQHLLLRYIPKEKLEQMA